MIVVFVICEGLRQVLAIKKLSPQELVAMEKVFAFTFKEAEMMHKLKRCSVAARSRPAGTPAFAGGHAAIRSVENRSPRSAMRQAAWRWWAWRWW